MAGDVEFQLQTVPGSVHGADGAGWHRRFGAVPISTQRCVTRPASSHQESKRSDEARQMEIGEKRAAIREARHGSGKRVEVHFRPGGVSRQLRGTTGRDHARQLRRKPVAAFRMRGRYVADLFSGQGGVAKYVRQFGFEAKEWERTRSEDEDLTCPAVQRLLRQDAASGRLMAAMLAPPRGSFSSANASVHRTREDPWGSLAGELKRLALASQLETSAREQLLRS